MTDKAETLRRLHHGPELLVLPNAWDVASARRFAAAGFPALATTSAGVAESLGWQDGERAPVDGMLAAVARIASAVEVPVTADMEAGYGLTADELAERLLETGAVGLNLEDTDHAAGGLVAAEAHAARIADLKAAAAARGGDLVVNARVDVHVRQVGPAEGRLAEAVRRGRLYIEAGADCVYPIGVADEETIAGLVEGIPGPVNVLMRPGVPDLDRLAVLGVRRVSYGSGLMRAALEAAASSLPGNRGATGDS